MHFFNLARPTAEVLYWLHELLDLMNNKGLFKGDGRSLKTIAKALKINETNLITVAARTPQKSALKLFRLLYSTISSRAELGSISKVPAQQLENIYCEYTYYLFNGLFWVSLFSLCAYSS